MTCSLSVHAATWRILYVVCSITTQQGAMRPTDYCCSGADSHTITGDE
jgi:hypothetical protein